MLKPPMVGRDDALRTLQRFLEDVLKEKGRVVFLSGEAGIGKTRLAEELERLARGKGFQMMVGWCIPGAPIPYQPFQEAFMRGQDGDQRGGKIVETLKKAAPDIAAATPVIGGYLRATASFFKEYKGTSADMKEESEKFLFGSLDFLRKLSSVNPVLIRIEDLQWADSGTIQLLHFLARNAAAQRVLIVGTFRSEEVEGKVAGEVHPLMESLRVMKREGVCIEISLKPLSLRQLGEAIEGMLGDPLDGALLRRISSESGGNPLFSSEIVRMLVERRAIVKEKGAWVAKEGMSLEIPETVSEVALRRLERLSPEERRVIDCAAVEGLYFHMRTLQDVLGADRLRLLESLEILERDHQLCQSSDGYFMFNHELICRVAYDQIAAPRRRELHRLIGLSLEKEKASPSRHGTLSLHFFKAGAVEKCAEYSLLAGSGCLWELLMPEAAIYFQRVLDCSMGSDLDNAIRVQALEGLGDAYASEEYMRCAEAITYYEKCNAETTDPRARARILRKMAWCWRPDQLGLGDSTKARELLHEAENCPNLDPGERGEILKTKAEIAHIEGKWDEVDRNCEEAEKLFAEAGAHERRAMILVNHATVDLCRGSVEDAIAKLDRASSLNAKYPSMGGETWIATSYAFTYMHQGEYDKTLQFLGKLLSLYDKTLDYGNRFGLLFYRALLYDIIGDFEAESEEVLKASELAEMMDSDYPRLGACVLAVHSCLRMNKDSEARSKGAQMLAIMGRFNFSMRSLTRNLAEIVQAELCYSQGKWEEGNKRFQDGIQMIRSGQYGAYFEAVVSTWYGECLARQGWLDDARLQYSKALGIFGVLKNSIELERIQKRLKSLG